MTTGDQPLSFRTIRSAQEFSALRDEWHGLFVRSGCSTASLTGAAVYSLLLHGSNADSAPMLVVALQGQRVVGGVPLTCTEAGGRLRVNTFADTQTYGVDCLADDAQPWVRMALLEHVIGAFGHAFSIVLEDIAATSNTVGCAHKLRHVAVHTDERRSASFLSVPATEEAIRSSVSSNFRKNLRKQEARLREATGVGFTFLTGADATPDLFDRFLSLEASGWKGQAGTAIASRERLRAYYATLTEELARDGQLEWHFLEANGRPIGGHLAVRTGSVLTLLKIAYDEVHAALAPGNMLFLEMLRREARNGGTTVVDCLTDMPWHQNWRMQRRLHLTVSLYPRRIGPLLFGYAPAVLADSVRKIQIARSTVRIIKKFGAIVAPALPGLRSRVK